MQGSHRIWAAEFRLHPLVFFVFQLALRSKIVVQCDNIHIFHSGSPLKQQEQTPADSENQMTVSHILPLQSAISVSLLEPLWFSLTWTAGKSRRPPAQLRWWASQSAPPTHLRGRNWWPSSCASGRRSGRSFPAQWQRQVQRQIRSTAKKSRRVVQCEQVDNY